MDPADFAGDFLMGTTVFIIGLIAGATLYYEIAGHAVTLDDIETEYDIHTFDLELSRLEISVFPEMLANGELMAAYRLGQAGGGLLDASAPYLWYDDQRTIRAMPPLLAVDVHSSETFEKTVDVSSYAGEQTLAVGIVSYSPSLGEASATANGIFAPLASGMTKLSVPYPTSGSLEIAVNNDGSALVEGIIISSSSAILSASQQPLQDTVLESYGKLQEGVKQDYALDGSLGTVFSPGMSDMFFASGLKAKTPPRLANLPASLTVKHDSIFLQKTDDPYWPLFFSAKAEAESGDSRKGEILSETTALPDSITHTDTFCAPASSKRSTCQQMTCDQLFLAKTGAQSLTSYVTEKVEHVLEGWSTSSKTFKLQSVSPLSGNTQSIVSTRTAEYTTVDHGQDYPTCGCETVKTCEVEPPKCTGSVGAACSHGDDVSCVADSFCEWTGTSCKKKSCSTWDSNKGACEDAGCSYHPAVVEANLAVCGCQAGFGKYSCSSTCTYVYNYTSTILGTVESERKAFVDSAWKTIVFKFLERMSASDEIIDHATSYATGV